MDFKKSPVSCLKSETILKGVTDPSRLVFSPLVVVTGLATRCHRRLFFSLGNRTEFFLGSGMGRKKVEVKSRDCLGWNGWDTRVV